MNELNIIISEETLDKILEFLQLFHDIQWKIDPYIREDAPLHEIKRCITQLEDSISGAKQQNN